MNRTDIRKNVSGVCSCLYTGPELESCSACYMWRTIMKISVAIAGSRTGRWGWRGRRRGRENDKEFYYMRL